MCPQSTFSSDISGNPLIITVIYGLPIHRTIYIFYDFEDYQIIGASPESLVSVKDGIVTTNPNCWNSASWK